MTSPSNGLLKKIPISFGPVQLSGQPINNYRQKNPKKIHLYFTHIVTLWAQKIAKTNITLTTKCTQKIAKLNAKT